MFEVMIDIETLASDPHAMVISIGAVRFDPITGKFGQDCYCNVRQDLQPGRTVSKDTLDWWAQQSPEARAAFMSPAPVAPGTALLALKAVCKGAGRVWANPPSFDLTILRDLCEDCRIEVPWGYRQEADYRTVKSLCKYSDIKLDEILTRADVPHNALEDAYAQALNLHRMLEALKQWEPK